MENLLFHFLTFAGIPSLPIAMIFVGIFVYRVIQENKEQTARDAYLDRLYAEKIHSGELGHIASIHSAKDWA
jgi:hypothetical protein